jgi:hypothetical protein
VWSRGTITAPASGVTDVSIYFNPIGAITNTQAVITWGQPASAGTLNSTFNQTSYALCNGPYSGAELVPSDFTDARLVSFEARIRYMGTELNRGGEIIGLQQPTHEPVTGMTTSTMLGHTSAVRFNVTQNRGWFKLGYRPCDVEDAYYLNTLVAPSTQYNAQYTSAGVSGGGSPPVVYEDMQPFMGAYITNPTASQPYEFEVWAVVEYTGLNVVGKTINTPDVQGYHCVLAALAQVDDAPYSQNRTAITSGSMLGSWRQGMLPGQNRNRPTVDRLRPVFNGDVQHSTNTRFDDALNVAGKLINFASPYVVNYIRQRYNPRDLMALD